MLDDVLAIPDHLRDALWRVESARLRAGRCGRADGLRDGRFGDRRGPRRRGARRPPRPAAAHRQGLRAAQLGDAGVGRALLQLLGRHRGDAQPASPPPGRSAPGASSSAPAAPWSTGARGRPAGGRPAGASCSRAPPVAYMFIGAAEIAALTGAAPRSTPRSRPPPPSWRRRRANLQSRAARCRRLAGGNPAGHLRRRPYRPRRAALEDPGQREREAPRLLFGAARGRPQRALRLGGRRSQRLRACRRPPRGRRPASSRAAPLRADRRGDRRSGRRGRSGRGGGRVPRCPAALGDDARRSRLAAAGRGPRRRPAPGRGDRALQGRARGVPDRTSRILRRAPRRKERWQPPPQTTTSPISALADVRA